MMSRMGPLAAVALSYRITVAPADPVDSFSVYPRYSSEFSSSSPAAMAVAVAILDCPPVVWYSKIANRHVRKRPIGLCADRSPCAALNQIRTSKLVHHSRPDAWTPASDIKLRTTHRLILWHRKERCTHLIAILGLRTRRAP